MKSEKEIRAYLKGLEKGLTSPCDCSSYGHETQCEVGARMMIATIETIKWILGENAGMDRITENYIQLGKEV